MNNLTPTQHLVFNMYKDEKGNPILLSPSQDYLFSLISMKHTRRVHCMCFTRFGKSLTVALAVLTRATTYPEKWAIVAGTKEKAKIIMDYVIQHIFDHEYTEKRFIPDKGESMEEIRRHRSKSRLTFATDKTENGKTLLSEIFIGSARDALGLGSQNVVEDESALINDTDHSLVMRMLGDNPHDNFLVKIGNPFYRNHFLASFQDPAYQKIVVDCYKGLQEGRITQDTIDENRSGIHFPVLFECKFPSVDAIDEQGWMSLLTETDILTAQTRQNQPAGVRKIGLDVARGGRNYNVFTLRTNTTAEVLKKDLEPDLIKTGDTLIELALHNGVAEEEIYIDDTGVGGGVTDYVKSRGMKRVNPVNFGEAAKDRAQFANTRAESYAGIEGVQAWIKQYGQLLSHPDWVELTKVRYKKDVSGRTKIESKDDMRKRGIESPDVADSLALTFAKAKQPVFHFDPEEVLAKGARTPFGGVPWEF